MGMQLTGQQSEAMEMLEKFISNKDGQIFILKGYAGTGKTFLVSCLAKYLLSHNILPEFMTPTGRAAKVLNRVLPADVEASTIHRRIYEYEGGGVVTSTGEFQKLRFPIRQVSGGGVHIVDEASMVSSKVSENELFEFGTNVLIEDLLTYARPLHGGKIIFVGDPAQLPPVGDNRSAALDENFFKEKGLRVDTYSLTDIVRQSKDSCILENATMLRNLLGQEERNTLVFRKKEREVMGIEPENVPLKYVEAHDRDSAIVCFSNKQASEYNKIIRSILFPGKPKVCVGDKLMVIRNNYYKNRILLNGDIITVVDMSDQTITQSAPVHTEVGGKAGKETIALTYRRILCRTGEGDEFHTYIIESLLESDRPTLTPDEFKSIYINLKIRHGKKNSETFKKFMEEDEFYNALQVKYGYAFTCHKAQGTEWDTVIVDFDKRTGLDTDSIRWKYTAVTRARKTLFCVNLPEIRALDNLRVRPIAKANGIAPTKLIFDEARKSPFHGDDAPALVNKYWSVVDNMQDDDSQYNIESVQSLPYRERYSVRTPNGEIVRIDAIYNKSGLFTKYDMPNGDSRLRQYFEDERNISYKIEYHPAYESLIALKNKMISVCEELGINVLSVEEKDWQSAFFLKTSGCNSVIRFFHNKKGEITSAEPLSEKGDNDEKLQQIVEKLKLETCQ